MQDLKFALRAFARTPGTSGLVVMTIAVAIAAATVIAGTIDMVWHFIPAVRTSGLVFVASTDPRPDQSQAGVADGLARTGVSIPDLADFSARTSTFQEFAGFTFQSAVLSASDAPSRISSVRTTHNLLRVWGVQPRMGRTFTAEDAAPGHPDVVIVSDRFWRNQLSGAADALGRTLTIDGRAHALVGVLPASAGTGMFTSMDVMVPIVLDGQRAKRDERRLYVTGLLKPGVAREQAEADVSTVARRLQSDYPLTNARTGVVVRPLIELLGGNIAAVMVLLSLVALIVVCIACANASSIILAHAATRRRELAVRAALGAGRAHQIRQFMVESLVISSAAGVAGLFLAWWGLVAVRFAGAGIDGFGDVRLSGRVLAVSVLLTLLSPLAFALLPALRMSKPDMEELRQGTRGAETRRGRWLRESLVVAQVALALILMTQVALIGRTAWRFHYMDRGFDPAQVLTLRMSLAEADYPDGTAADRFYMRALERIQAVPGVTSAGTIDRLPVADRQANVRFAIQGRPLPPPGSRPSAAQSAISANYLQTLRIPIVRGRGFVPADFGNAPRVALVSRETARQHWPGQDAIGARIALDESQDEWFEVVGMTEDVRNTSAGLALAPQIYVPSSRKPARTQAFVVRASGSDPLQLAASIRREMAGLDKNQPVYDVKSMERQLTEDLGGTYLFTGMLAVFAVIALLLAAAGVYGLVSFSVSQRTREIGVRMALGARPASILGMVVAHGSVAPAIGALLGSAGAAVLTSVTSQALPEIDVRDPLAYLVVAVPLIVVAAAATWLPARRATLVDPLLALRAE